MLFQRHAHLKFEFYLISQTNMYFLSMKDKLRILNVFNTIIFIVSTLKSHFQPDLSSNMELSSNFVPTTLNPISMQHSLS